MKSCSTSAMRRDSLGLRDPHVSVIIPLFGSIGRSDDAVLAAGLNAYRTLYLPSARYYVEAFQAGKTA